MLLTKSTYRMNLLLVRSEKRTRANSFDLRKKMACCSDGLEMKGLPVEDSLVDIDLFVFLISYYSRTLRGYFIVCCSSYIFLWLRTNMLFCC